jgi:hypothetical protein
MRYVGEMIRPQEDPALITGKSRFIADPTPIAFCISAQRRFPGAAVIPTQPLAMLSCRNLGVLLATSSEHRPR